MRALLIITIVSSTAVADPKADAEAVVKKHLSNVMSAPVLDTMTADAVVYVGGGSREPRSADDIKYTIAPNIKVKDAPATTIGKLEVVVDADNKRGWFTAPLTLKYTTDKGKKATSTARVGGVLVDDGGWKIAAVQYAQPISDAELVKDLGDINPIDASRFKGDATVLAAGKDMFKTGFVKSASANAAIQAVGTSPAEVGTTAKTAKAFAKNWDGAKLEPVDMKARMVGKVGIVQGVARWPIKGKAAYMSYLGALVEEGGSWRWVGLYWNGS